MFAGSVGHAPNTPFLRTIESFEHNAMRVKWRAQPQLVRYSTADLANAGSPTEILAYPQSIGT